MSEIKFFTPVYYGPLANTLEKKAIENIDSFFHFYGRKAVVMTDRSAKSGIEKVVFSDTKFSTKTLFKVIGIVLSYFTVIIPLAMLVSKAVLRSSHHYKLLASKELEPPNILIDVEKPQKDLQQEVKPVIDPKELALKAECKNILDQKLDFDVKDLQKELLNKAPNEAQDDIKLFFFFYDHRTEIFESFTQNSEIGKAKVLQLQIQDDVSRLPLTNKKFACDAGVIPTQELKDIAHELMSIKILYDAHQADPIHSEKLFQEITEGACFNAKREKLFEWIQKHTKGAEELKKEILNGISFDNGKPWRVEGKNILYRYLDNNQEAIKEDVPNVIMKIIDGARFEGIEVTLEDITKLVNDNWDNMWRLIH